MALLEVNHLQITLQTHRGPAVAVRDMSFSIERGDSLGLIGESGCGKSLTAMALLGLLPEQAQVSGSVLFDGKELANAEESVLCDLRGNRIGMVFQEPMTALNPVHTVGHQVAEPLRLHKGMSARQAREESIALLNRVGLPDASRRVDAYPHQFSGGQRQRITIAMALACGPDLLIADEPTTALDVSIQRQILELIQGIVQERNMALLLISHDLKMIAQNVNRMMVMYGGSVMESGPTEVVFSDMEHPYTRGLFAARPLLGQRGADGKPARLTTIEGTVPELADLPTGCRFHGRCPIGIEACALGTPPPIDLGNRHVVRCIRGGSGL